MNAVRSLFIPLAVPVIHRLTRIIGSVALPAAHHYMLARPSRSHPALTPSTTHAARIFYDSRAERT